MTSFEEFFSRFTSDGGSGEGSRTPFGVARGLFAQSPLARIAAAGVVALASGALVLTVFSGTKVTPISAPAFIETQLGAPAAVKTVQSPTKDSQVRLQTRDFSLKAPPKDRPVRTTINRCSARSSTRLQRGFWRTRSCLPESGCTT